jgi:hypothetical protein
LVKQMRRPQNSHHGSSVNLVGRLTRPPVPLPATASVPYPLNDCISPLSDAEKFASLSTPPRQGGDQDDGPMKSWNDLCPATRVDSSCSLLSFEESNISFEQPGAVAAPGRVGLDASLSQTQAGYLSGEESDEDIRKLFAITDRFVGPALLSLQGVTAGSPGTSPVRTVSEESSYEAPSASGPTPPTLPVSPRHFNATQTEAPLAPSFRRWDAA